MAELEDIFKAIVSIIFLIIFLGAMGPLFIGASLPDFSSIIVGFSSVFIVLLVLIKLLEVFGNHDRY